MRKNILMNLVFAAIGITSLFAQEKNEMGISVDAPEGVHQYAFRIGEWDGVSKDLKALNEWTTKTSRSRVFVAENGLTFIEEGLDENGEVLHTITYDYDEESDTWNNVYSSADRKVEYTSKMSDGRMVETIQRADNVNHNEYTVVSDNVLIYTARRTYKNGFQIITHVGVSTKIIN